MRSSKAIPAAFIAAALVAVGTALGPPSSSSAQVFGPPMTVFGSVTDDAGPVEEGLPVEAYIGNQVCGRGQTQRTGEGSGRITVYYADVVSREQTAGCGAPGVEVRIKIGERFADDTTEWRAGPVQLDVTFGSATPAPIPTFTPTPNGGAPQPTRPPATPTPAGPTEAPSPSPSPTATPTQTSTATPTPTLAGGLVTREAERTPSAGDTGGDGGFPVWAAVVIGIGAIVAVGGGVGFLMARSRPAEADEDPFGDL